MRMVEMGQQELRPQFKSSRSWRRRLLSVCCSFFSPSCSPLQSAVLHRLHKRMTQS